MTDRSKLFLRAYNETAARYGDIDPLNDMETGFLPQMISLANLHVINWTVEEYYAAPLDPSEYEAFLLHGIGLVKRGGEGIEVSL